MKTILLILSVVPFYDCDAALPHKRIIIHNNSDFTIFTYWICNDIMGYYNKLESSKTIQLEQLKEINWEINYNKQTALLIYLPERFTFHPLSPI